MNLKDYLIEKLRDPKEAKRFLKILIEEYLKDNNVQALVLGLQYLKEARNGKN